MKRAWFTLLGVALAACAPSADAPAPPEPPRAQEFTVLVDAAAPPGIQISTYFPGVVQARPGDTVRFHNRGPNAPHTITFGVASDRSDAPLPVTAEGQFNPVAFGPCFTGQAPSVTLASCPEPPAAVPPAFDGTGLWSSGLLAPAAPGVPAEQTSVAVTLADDIPPGRYPYVCLLHPFMGGVVEVVDGDTPLAPAEVAATGAAQEAEALSAATAVTQPEPVAGDGLAVNAGWGDQVVAVNQFGPERLEVPAGTTVTWTGRSPYEPHTITFGDAPFAGPDDPAALLPAGPSPGGDYTGGFAHSGFIGPAPAFPSDAYTLRFPTPGTYPYLCVLHPGMKGEVVVVPA